VNATVDQPGWQEGQKIAGRAYAEASAPIGHLSEPKTLSAAALLNREHTLRWIDGVLAALQALRNDINAQDAENLEKRLERARRGRGRWWQERQAGDWAAAEATPPIHIPTSTDFFGKLFGRGTKK
jgi:predicted component of type VI protein secretion system